MQSEPPPSSRTWQVPISSSVGFERTKHGSAGKKIAGHSEVFCLKACSLLQDCASCSCGLTSFCSFLCCLILTCTLVIFAIFVVRCAKHGLDTCLHRPL